MCTRILTLDGGGSKAWFPLGALKVLESCSGKLLYELFDMIAGTSTGSIIATFLVLGYSVDEIHKFYQENVREVMRKLTKAKRSNALNKALTMILGKRTFYDVKRKLIIPTTCADTKKPVILKSDDSLAYGRKGTFIPGFGLTLADGVEASCSAYPYFDYKIVTTSSGIKMRLFDGGYYANNPTIYAITDALRALKVDRSSLQVLSVGTGSYPDPNSNVLKKAYKNFRYGFGEEIFEINAHATEALCHALFNDINIVRINNVFAKQEMVTNLLETDLNKLNLLYKCGQAAFGEKEDIIKKIFL